MATRVRWAWFLLGGGLISLFGLASVFAFHDVLPGVPTWARWAVVLIGMALPALALVMRLGDGRRVTGRKVWLAREGLVEEGRGLVILFPWEQLVGFDLSSRRGRSAIRVWLDDGAVQPFVFLDASLPPPERAAWAAERQQDMRSDLASTGAPLVLERDELGKAPNEVFEQLRRIADDPRSLGELPSVLDNPPDIDLTDLWPR